MTLQRCRSSPPEQQNFLRAILKQETLAALDEGLALAVQMIRKSPPGLTRDQLANLIKNCIGDKRALVVVLSSLDLLTILD